MPEPRDARSIIEKAEQAAAASNYAAAEDFLREAATLQEQTLGPDHPDLANTLNNLGVVCEMADNPIDAEHYFRRAHTLATATLALSLTWAGATVGRLLSSAISDRFDHLRFTIVCIVSMGLAIGAAVAAPSLPLSIALFTLAGVASGPVFPMIVALGGERYPERSAAVGGSLVGFAVVGSTIYPPAIGFLSVTVGLPIAMAGNAVLCLLGAGALIAFGRSRDQVTGVAHQLREP